MAIDTKEATKSDEMPAEVFQEQPIG